MVARLSGIINLEMVSFVESIINNCADNFAKPKIKVICVELLFITNYNFSLFS